MKVRRITMAIFTGAGVAIVTPFNEDGSINYDRLDELIEFHCAHKTDSIVICGTTGESATMTEEEHMQCVKFTIDRVNKRVPVIAGTGSNCTETAIMMSKEAASYGADALLIVTPYYNKATQKGLIAHYTAIANAVPETPLIMYNVPIGLRTLPYHCASCPGPLQLPSSFFTGWVGSAFIASPML